MIIDIADRLSNHIVLFGITLILGTFVHIWYSESRDIVNKRGLTLTRSFVISKFGCTYLHSSLFLITYFGGMLKLVTYQQMCSNNFGFCKLCYKIWQYGLACMIWDHPHLHKKAFSHIFSSKKLKITLLLKTDKFDFQ